MLLMFNSTRYYYLVTRFLVSHKVWSIDTESSSMMALHSLLEEGDLGAGELGSGVGEAGEVDELLNHQCQHVGNQDLVEALHGVGELPGQGLHVAQGGVGAGAQG